jgi:hypothetical protein
MNRREFLALLFYGLMKVDRQTRTSSNPNARLREGKRRRAAAAPNVFVWLAKKGMKV